MNRIWTDVEIEIIRTERAKGTQVPVIARRLDRPVPATYLRARLIGTLVQPHRAATDAEKAMIRTMATAVPASSDEEIAAAIGRTVGSTRYILTQIGLVGVRDLGAMTSARYVPRAPDPARLARLAEQKAARAPRKTTERILKVRPPKVRVSKPVIDDGRAAEKARLRAERGAARAAALLIKNAKRDERARVRAEAEAAKAARAAAKAADAARRELVKVQAAERRKAAAEARADADRLRKERDRLRAAGEARAAARRHASEAAAYAVAEVAVRAEALPVAAPVYAHDPDKTSGRGGWARKGFRPYQPKLAALAPKGRGPLPKGEQDAIARFLAERGATRIVEDEVTAAANALRRRGYVVLRRGDEGYLIDGLREIANDTALVEFARVRLDRAA